MTIEVRQLLIKSQVGVNAPQPPAGPGANAAARELEQAKAQILAECKAWLTQRLNDARER